MTARTLALLTALVVAGCDCGSPPALDGGGIDASPLDASPDASPDSGSGPCERPSDCDDGSFCNGVEQCQPGEPNADARGCTPGEAPCAAEETCSEENDRCEVPDCTEPDADTDGHDSIACGGDDCDDDDVNRYPGNPEVCDDGHDEDCNPNSLGGVDLDGDGFVSSACCNGAVCGDDCNDLRRDVHPDATELCNAIDDQCDGAIDEPGAFCPQGTCVDSRCRSISWERVYASDGGDFTFGLNSDNAGNIYAGIHLPGTGGDYDEDSLADPPGFYVVSIAPDGRFRWGAATQGGGEEIAVGPDGSWIAVATGDALVFLSSSDGQLLGQIDANPFDQWTHTSVVDVDRVGLSVVATVGLFHLVDGDVVQSGIQLLRIGSNRQLLGSTVLAGAGGRVNVFDSDGADGFFAITGSSTETFALEDSTSVPSGGFVLVMNGETLAALWLISEPGLVARVVAVDSDGAASIAGRFTGPFSPSWGGTWPGGESVDSYVASFGSDGSPFFTRVHSGPLRDINQAIDYDGRGNVMVAGYFSGNMMVSPRPTLIHTPDGEGDNCDAYFVLLGREDGFVVDARQVSGNRCESVRSAVVDPFGGLVLLGTFDDDVVLPSGSPYESTDPPFSADLYFVRVSDL